MQTVPQNKEKFAISDLLYCCEAFIFTTTLVHILVSRRPKVYGHPCKIFIFQNDVCYGDGSLRGNAGRLSGNCYTKQECDELGGTAAGECADGYGVCCVCKDF